MKIRKIWWALQDLNKVWRLLKSISMDCKGRWVDNVFVERLWHTVKYEDIYPSADETPTALRTGLDRCFRFYNT